MFLSIRTIRTLPALSLALFATASLAASISGTVTDRTTGKPSKGDTIAVINTAQSMDEIAKVTSDAQGHFQVNAPDGGQILLHITHNGEDLVLDFLGWQHNSILFGHRHLQKPATQ